MSYSTSLQSLLLPKSFKHHENRNWSPIRILTQLVHNNNVRLSCNLKPCIKLRKSWTVTVQCTSTKHSDPNKLTYGKVSFRASMTPVYATFRSKLRNLEVADLIFGVTLQVAPSKEDQHTKEGSKNPDVSKFTSAEKHHLLCVSYPGKAHDLK